ncbi:hypothetical protein BBJ28_00008380 [Nothophytophthora sp. Chile5]|nr:hypothetical protein BBJ28_00008380 [Nothophytophthora sp. Chile5]
MATARHHLTIQEKNQLRACHRERPDMTQEQLREWAHARFGKWVGRSTIGKIASMPEEACANPTAKRNQSGRYPEMERELYAFIVATAAPGRQDGEKPLTDDLPVLSEAVLWAKANEILKTTRGSDQSVSVGWVQRFKKRHGLHRSQRVLKLQTGIGSDGLAGANAPVMTAIAAQKPEQVPAVGGAGGETTTATVAVPAAKESGDAVTVQPVAQGKRSSPGSARKEDDEVAPPPRKKLTTEASTAKAGGNRKQFVSADDIVLLSQVLLSKPWAFPHAMDGWQQVAAQLRAQSAFRLEKTAGACQARVTLLLDHLRAGNEAALRKSGTAEEYTRKHELLQEVQSKLTAYHELMEDMRKRRGDVVAPSIVTQHDAAVAKVGEAAAAAAAAEATGAGDVDGQRRLEMLERKMEREMAEQRRHADEQVRQLERLQRTQLEAQQTQHAQLLATIQQQQAMMLDLIKSVAPTNSQNQARDL